MLDEQRIGEVIEACSRDFVGQCYELYQTPSLGRLVRTRCDTDPDTNLYGVVYNVLTNGMDPTRRPVARGKDETDEDEIYRASPQLMKLLKSEFHVLVIGCQKEDQIFQHLPPVPARIHGFVYLCTPEEVKQFSRSFDFLNILLKTHLDIPTEELVGAVLRQMSEVYGLERHVFLVSAGKELANLLSTDYSQLRIILKGLKNDTT